MTIDEAFQPNDVSFLDPSKANNPTMVIHISYPFLELLPQKPFC